MTTDTPENNLIKLELTELEANSFVLFQKYYPQFMKLAEKDIFNKEFTGRIVLDILQGDVKNLQKVMSYHFQIRI